MWLTLLVYMIVHERLCDGSWRTRKGRWKDAIWRSFKAYFADNNADHLFVSHSPLMPGTLALIITASYGSTFKGNIDRLIGLVLGNVIPLLVLAVVFSFDCASWCLALAS